MTKINQFTNKLGMLYLGTSEKKYSLKAEISAETNLINV